MSERRRGGAFTLIELLAVVLILGLVAGLVLPNLGLLSTLALGDQARHLAADLEFARQRTVMTGIRHRMLLDLDRGAWWLEWEVADDSLAEPAAPEPSAPGASRLIDLSPPRAAALAFRPLPSGLGRPSLLDDDLYFTGVETTAGRIESGQVFVTFARDGAAEPTVVGLGTENGEELRLEILPLADAVQVRDASS